MADKENEKLKAEIASLKKLDHYLDMQNSADEDNKKSKKIEEELNLM